MYELKRTYIFKVKSPETEKGFTYYTGIVEGIESNIVFIHTIKNEDISFSLNQILKSKDKTDE